MNSPCRFSLKEWIFVSTLVINFILYKCIDRIGSDFQLVRSEVNGPGRYHFFGSIFLYRV